MSELKPCLKCQREVDWNYIHQTQVEVQCECGLTFGRFDTYDELVANWNRRPDPWIKIESPEDLPKDGQRILFKYYSDIYAGHYTGMFSGICFTGDIRTRTLEHFEDEEISIWFPLPSPPEDK